jgi:oligoendopeptidase F
MDISSLTPSRWSLAELLQPDQDVESLFERIRLGVEAFEKHRVDLTANIDAEYFLKITHDLEIISRDNARLYSYAGLAFTEDTQNQSAQALVARVDQMMAEMDNRTMFFSLWWKALDDPTAERLMAAAGDYRYWLEEMRHFKPHTLSEAEEKVVNTKNVTGVNAFNTLYDAITNRYTFKLEIDGQEQELTRGELMVFARHHDADLRARAYKELYHVYGADGPILGQIYQTIVRDWHNEQVEMRHFSAPISARNLMNDIPDPAVDALLSVCRDNASIFQRYFHLKARWLGVDQLRRYDIYAPVAPSDKTYTFPQAVERVMASFDAFDPQMGEMARRVFTAGHLDSQVRKGKRSGAFCWTVLPEQAPWVMVNYQGRPDDAATLAHELGHSIHSQLSAGHSLFTQHACLPLAETASTFSEMMLIDRLLSNENDDRVRRDLLFRQVDDAYATIMRQAFFALFERQAHDLTQAGASVDELSDAYLQNLRLQFGDAVELSDEFRWEWVSIPHIFNTPFYVYAYAFGQLLVLSLYREYKNEGESFKPRYLKILAAGGSRAPEALLREAGIDIRSEEFWQGGFDVVRGLVEQLEAIAIA